MELINALIRGLGERHDVRADRMDNFLAAVVLQTVNTQRALRALFVARECRHVACGEYAELGLQHNVINGGFAGLLDMMERLNFYVFVLAQTFDFCGHTPYKYLVVAIQDKSRALTIQFEVARHKVKIVLC